MVLLPLLVSCVIGMNFLLRLYSPITASGAGVLGHPFGRVPVLRPFDANQKEAEIILSDPANPVGKDLIAGELETTLH